MGGFPSATLRINKRGTHLARQTTGPLQDEMSLTDPLYVFRFWLRARSTSLTVAFAYRPLGRHRMLHNR
jgi:hypothetical protein